MKNEKTLITRAMLRKIRTPERYVFLTNPIFPKKKEKSDLRFLREKLIKHTIDWQGKNVL